MLAVVAMTANPVLAEQVVVLPGMPPPVVADQSVTDLEPQIKAIENQIAKLEQRPVVRLTAFERKQLASLQRTLATIQAAQKSAKEAASAADESKGWANDSAVAAAKGAAEAEQSAKDASASAITAQNAVRWIEGLAPWVIAVVTALGSIFVFGFIKLVRMVTEARNESRVARADAAAANNRFKHDIRCTPQTPSVEQLSVLPVGTTDYPYEIKVNGNCEIHYLSIPCLAESGLPLVLVGELFSTPVTPEDVFLRVCDARERFGINLPPMLVSV